VGLVGSFVEGQGKVDSSAVGMGMVDSSAVGKGRADNFAVGQTEVYSWKLGHCCHLVCNLLGLHKQATVVEDGSSFEVGKEVHSPH